MKNEKNFTKSIGLCHHLYMRYYESLKHITRFMLFVYVLVLKYIHNIYI